MDTNTYLDKQLKIISTYKSNIQNVWLEIKNLGKMLLHSP
jgi:hypothetical protein